MNIFGYTNPADWDIPSTLRALSIGTQPANSDCDARGKCGPRNPDSPTNCEIGGTVELDDFYGRPPAGKLQRFAWPTDYMDAAGCPAQLSSDGQTSRGPR